MSQSSRAYAVSHVTRQRHLVGQHAIPPLLSSTLSRSSLFVSQRFFSASSVARQERMNEGSRSPPSRVLYIGNLPYSVESADLERIFSPFGEVQGVRIGSDEQGRSRGFAHVEFVKEEDAVAAYDSAGEEPFFLVGRNLNIDYAREKVKREQAPTSALHFVDFQGDENDLVEILKEYSPDIMSINFINSRRMDGKPDRGFIAFNDVKTATAVMETMNGLQAENGLKLQLSYAYSPRGPMSKGQRGRR
ncbi:hypothetical protein AX17_003050 [Amanita inopinata Kibby_2008]|nr:hypothetical protein AX17_003050 [Amanita inopinata Kibby_2008]